MLNKIIRAISALIGITLGVAAYLYAVKIIPQINGLANWQQISLMALSGIIIGLIFYFLSPWVIKEGKDVANWIENEIANVPPIEVLFGSIGLIIGLIIAYLVSQLFMQIPIPMLGTIMSLVLYIFMGYVGMNTGRRKFDMSILINKFSTAAKDMKSKSNQINSNPSKIEYKATPKILDTSVIIDGRIYDICKTGFVEGKILVPTFVLEELRHIADSSDDLKRVRGRRGLDILNALQKEEGIDVEIYEKDFEENIEVDTKLLKLCEILGGKVVTNDFNLNKVAQFQGVKVLNINELANAVKPVVIPGEEMQVQIVKEGKEQGQGVAYLDDGTMIVVEGARKKLNEHITVVVTSVLQTAAGRMIFGRPK